MVGDRGRKAMFLGGANTTDRWMGGLNVCVRWIRLRVKDINDAIKELGQMIAAHTGAGQPMTRLMIVQEAVTVITGLEQQLRGNDWTTHVDSDEGFTCCVHGQDLKQEHTECMRRLLLVLHGQPINAEAIDWFACHLMMTTVSGLVWRAYALKKNLHELNMHGSVNLWCGACKEKVYRLDTNYHFILIFCNNLAYFLLKILFWAIGSDLLLCSSNFKDCTILDFLFF